MDGLTPQALWTTIRRGRLIQVLAVYLGASFVVLEAVDILIDRLGLPDWVFPGALVLLLIGLPIILTTALVQSAPSPAPQAQAPDTTTPTAEPTRQTSAADVAAVAKHWLTWRNAIMGCALAFGLWGVIATGWLLLQRNTDRMAADAPASSMRIAVFPFSVRGGEEMAYLGEGMVDLLSTKLDGAGGWRRVDPRAVLARLGRNGIRAPDPQSGREIAERFDAKLYVLGNVVEVGGLLRVDASLYNADHGLEAVTVATAEGEASEIFDLVDHLAAQLLLGQTAGPAVRMTRIAAVTTNSLSALKHYLQGERAFRAGHFVPAVEAFQRATQADSAFALAWYRLSVAADWLVRADLVRMSAEQAVRYSGRLSEHDRRLFEALQTVRRADVVEAERLYHAILGTYPDDVEAWFQLGELQFHFGPFRGQSVAESREDFERVLSFEPNDLHSLTHLVRIAAVEAKYAELEALVSRYLGLNPEADRAIEIRALRAFALEDAPDQRAVLGELRRAPDGTLMVTAWAVAIFTGNIAGAFDLATLLTEPSRSPEIQVLGHVYRANLELARGRWSRAKAELEATEPLDPAAFLERRATLSAVPFLPVPERELQALRGKLVNWAADAVRPSATPSTWLDVHDDVHPHLRLYLLGLLSARLGEEGTALRYAAELELSDGPTHVTALARDLAQGVRAQVASAREDFAEALAALEQARMQTWYQRMAASPFYSQAYDRYLRAELLAALNSDQEALRWYSSFGEGSVYDLIYLAPSHLRRGEIYERLGEREKAALHYKRFIELWKDGDPVLQPRVEAARRAIRALSPDT